MVVHGCPLAIKSEKQFTVEDELMSCITVIGAGFRALTATIHRLI